MDNPSKVFEPLLFRNRLHLFIEIIRFALRKHKSHFYFEVFDKDGFALVIQAFFFLKILSFEAFKDEDWCPKTFIFDSSNTITQEFLDYYESHPEVRWIWKPYPDGNYVNIS